MGPILSPRTPNNKDTHDRASGKTFDSMPRTQARWSSALRTAGNGSRTLQEKILPGSVADSLSWGILWSS